MSFGRSRALPWETLEPRWQQALARFEGFEPPGGETFAELRARVLVLRRLAAAGTAPRVHARRRRAPALARGRRGPTSCPQGSLLVVDWEARRSCRAARRRGRAAGRGLATGRERRRHDRARGAETNCRAGGSMKRRGFLGCGALAGAVVWPRGDGIGVRPRREPAVRGAAVRAGGGDVAELQRRMASGAAHGATHRELYLARIAALDRTGPQLRSVIETNPDALAIADALDAERKGEGAARPAARHPGAAQGQHRHRRPHDDHRRLARARGLAAAARRPRRRPAARGRRRHPRQDQPLASGRTSARRARRRAGAAAAASAATRTRSTATRAARARARAPPSRRTSPRSRSAPRPTARSSARRRPAASSGIKPTVGLVSRAGIIPIAGTPGHGRPDGAHRGRRGGAAAALAGADPRDAGHGRGRRAREPTTRASSTRRACAARASASARNLAGFHPGHGPRCSRRRSPS